MSNRKPSGAQAPLGDPVLVMSRRPGGRVMAGLAYTPPAASERNEVQLVTITATGGTFKLTFNGAQTGALAFDAAASAVQTALRALSTVAGANVTVTGSAGGPYTVTFVNDLGEQNVPQMTADATALTGTTHTAVVTTTQQGSN